MHPSTLLLLILVGCGGAGPSHDSSTVRENALNPTAPTQCLGFLESADWNAERLHIVAFALVETARQLDQSAAQWQIKHKSWCTDSALIRRFRDSPDVEDLTRGHLTIDPTRYIAVAFNPREYRLMEVADLGPGRDGTAIFADAHCPLSPGFAAVMIESHSLPEFTVP